MSSYLTRHSGALAIVGIAGILALIAFGAGWGIVALSLYGRLWSPYVAAYISAAGTGDTLLLGGRVSLGAVAFHGAAIVILMAPWALITAACFMRFVTMVDDFLAYSLNGDSH